MLIIYKHNLDSIVLRNVLRLLDEAMILKECLLCNHRLPWSLFLAFCFLFTSNINIANAQDLPPVLVAKLGSWHPYTSSNRPEYRAMEKLVQKIFKGTGIKIEFHYVPWARAKKEVLTGHADITFPWFNPKDVEKDFIVCSEPLMRFKEFFFKLSSNQEFSWESFKDLHKYRIGGTLGYSHNKVLKQNGIDVDISKTVLANFQKLELGRIDAFPENIQVAKFVLNSHYKNEKIDRFTIDPKPLVSGGLFVLLSKKKPYSIIVKEMIDERLIAIKKTPEYEEIVRPDIWGRMGQ